MARIKKRLHMAQSRFGGECDHETRVFSLTPIFVANRVIKPDYLFTGSLCTVVLFFFCI